MDTLTSFNNSNTVLVTSENGSSPLCQKCHSMFRWKSADKSLSREPRTVQQILQSAVKGCHLCFLLCMSWTDEDKLDLVPKKLTEFALDATPKASTKPKYTLQHIADVPLKGEQTRSVDIIPITDTDSQISKAARTSDSYQTFSTVKTWFDNCSDNHEQCRKRLSQHEYIPTRLIDVGAGNHDTIRLTSKADVSHDTKYLTLSHTWGDQSPVSLTGDTEKRLKNGLPYSELPKTFKDAVTIARELDIRYLWIDSLCIRQDCPEDWSRESASMSDIYRNSWCNIVAAHAKSVKGGCFSSRSPRAAMPCRVNIENGTGQQLHQCASETHLLNELENTAVSSRAWALQETLLAPRSLHYTRNQVYWECNGLLACEACPEGLKPNDESLVQSFQNIAKVKRLDEEVSYHLWLRIVERYSQRNLTYPEKDKLMAISGLAKCLIPPQQYLAGMWARPALLSSQLLWHLSSPVKKTQLGYIAPSWSWASIDGGKRVNNSEYGLTFDNCTNNSTNKTLIKIIKSEVNLKNPDDRFGAITSGHMDLKGAVITAELSMPSFKVCHYEGAEIKLKPDVSGIHYRSRLRFVPVKLDPVGESITGLLIEPTRNQKDEYRRLGLFTVTNQAVAWHVQNFWNLVREDPEGKKWHGSSVPDLDVEDIKGKWSDIRLV
ncbi:hypothetical protein PVAG01_00737 [Phlyctema vagabunda]|uniref:Heterokaryon incompatibility domain-containing protein n=1 Tax=Phlyctema vagabunda TaxID=108571 RepID=A0ABR4PV31_9HELO